MNIDLFCRRSGAANPCSGSTRVRMLCLAWTCALLGGCAGSLLPPSPTAPVLLSLEDRSPAQASLFVPQPPANPATRSLIVDLPRAAPGFDTRLMAYQRRAHEVAYFAAHQWVEPPASMLLPLLVHVLQGSGAFSVVVAAPTLAMGDWRLQTEAVRLQQDFSQVPSQVRLSFRVLLIETATRQVRGERDIAVSVVAPADDPYGGAIAAHRAAQQALAQVAEFASKTRAPVGQP